MKSVTAKLRFLPPEQGGRRSRLIGPHYSTAAEFEGVSGGSSSEAWSIIATFRDAIDEGGDVTAEIEFLSPEAPQELLAKGARFTLVEGTRTVARGEFISSSAAAEIEGARARTLNERYAAAAALVKAWSHELHLDEPDFDPNTIDRMRIDLEAA